MIQKAFPILYKLYSLAKQGVLTQSAARTYHLVKKGYQIDKISKVRHLKYNTIEDHIVEIALYDRTFDIQTYVDENIQHQIMSALNEAKTNKLKEIKGRISGTATYFQIRLVLARVSETRQ